MGRPLARESSQRKPGHGLRRPGLACWGDHFDVERALSSPDYVHQRWSVLQAQGLVCHAIANHLVGQAVCDLIDVAIARSCPPEVWGDGDPEGVRQRAAQRMIDTAKAARASLMRGRVRPRSISRRWSPVSPVRRSGHAVYAFPPTSQAYLQQGFDDFARRWRPILDAFDAVDVNFALEVHPTEIAFDIASAQRALEAVDHHPRFGFNFDPSHFAYQGVDYVRFLRTFGERIYHVHMKDVWWGRGDGSVGVFGGHTDFGDARRHWDFRSVGRGDVRFQDIIVALNDIGYRGPLSVEWEDARMDRVHGAAEAAAYVRQLDFPPSAVAFDAAFERGRGGMAS